MGWDWKVELVDSQKTVNSCQTYIIIQLQNLGGRKEKHMFVHTGWLFGLKNCQKI